MAVTRGDVSCIEASKILCELDTVLVIPIPPRRTGRASSSLSTLEQGGRPGRVGIRYS